MIGHDLASRSDAPETFGRESGASSGDREGRRRAKIHPDLALACLRHKRDREYRLWTLARAVDTAGTGRLAVTDLQDALDTWGIKGVSPGTVRRLLNAGEAAFWHRYNRRIGGWFIALSGLAAVCLFFGVDKLRHSPVYVPLELVRTVKKFRAAIFASPFARGDDG